MSRISVPRTPVTVPPTSRSSPDPVSSSVPPVGSTFNVPSTSMPSVALELAIEPPLKSTMLLAAAISCPALVNASSICSVPPAVASSVPPTSLLMVLPVLSVSVLVLTLASTMPPPSFCSTSASIVP